MKVSWARGSVFLVTLAMLKTHDVCLHPHSVSEPLQARCCCLIRPTRCGAKVGGGRYWSHWFQYVYSPAPFVWLICWRTAALEQEKNKKKIKKIKITATNPAGDAGAAASRHPFTATAAAACLPVDRCSFWQAIYHYDKCNTSIYPYIHELKNEPS